MNEYMGLMEVARLLKVAYYRIIFAEEVGSLPLPKRIANKRIYTPDHIERLRKYFADRPLKPTLTKTRRIK